MSTRRTRILAYLPLAAWVVAAVSLAAAVGLTALILALLAFAVLAAVVFLAAFGPPWRHEDRAMAWHVWLWVGMTLVADAALLLLGLRVRVPMWLFAVAYGGTGLVTSWRVGWVLRRNRYVPHHTEVAEGGR